MNSHHRTAAGLALALLLGILGANAFADVRGDRGRTRPPPPQQNPYYDHRFNHDRYYPRRGYVVPQLPHGWTDARYRGVPYYVHGGVWYRSRGSGFAVVTPPIGAVVSLLPPYYTRIWIGGVPYYYANDTYYLWEPSARGYVVARPPRDAESAAVSTVSDELFVYPKNGQSGEQQATDRYECHRWAVGQTGYDPTQPLGGVSESTAANKRIDYQRAQATCLEGRGYSVK